MSPAFTPGWRSVRAASTSGSITITPLLFSYAGTKERDQLKATGIDARRLYPSTTLYQQLAKQGIASYVLAHGEYTPSTYSDIVYVGATQVGYRTLPEALVNLRLLLAEQRKPTYYMLYFDRLDALCHEYGPNAPQVDAELDTFLTTLERQLLAQLDGGRGDTLVLLTADHGQSETHPLRTIYLNTHPDFSGFERYQKTNRQGKPIDPAGSPRDFFLYVRDELLEEAHDYLAHRLAGRAVVYRTADLITAGFFGAAPVSKEFLGRVGNLVVLPYRGEAVWWYEKDRFEQKYLGHHGGLTPQEMEIPLLAWAA
jgi:hypothetical protein